ncbi:RCC1-like G exchanging factor-like protein [Procambarus clarkii]|uniref:RCC1-like G exchanging factor-like protein n=1 Tax=Procambarus clarkii TaxID=6728 RepID=UPI001E6721B8|nr:RCC1-like G exchanging factor-like protein [Procambarus clarkii]XP_045609754.1 RCC1-like G exchanging factor-like protein [Procambarus clarkii]
MMYCTPKSLSSPYKLITRVLQVSSGCGSARHSIRGKKSRYRQPLDPQHAEELPEFEYVGVHSRPDTLIYTWGVADHGALGRASLVRPEHKKKQHHLHYLHHPHRLEFGEYFKVIDVACGYGFTLFAVDAKSGASCFGTGLNTESQIGRHEPRKDHPLGILISPAPIDVPLSNNSKIVKVSSGRAHSVMVTDREGVWTVGSNGYGQCGRPIIPNEDYGKQAVYHRIRALDGVKVCQVECGQDTSFFLSEEGVVYSCGWGADGQTGRGHYNNEPNVGPVMGDVVGEKIVKISCRADCALALSDKGEVFGWGNSEYHQLNSVTDEMQIHTAKKLQFPDIRKVVDVASAGTMCMFINEDGQVYSWGFGPLGKGPKVSYSKTPTPIPLSLFGHNEITPDAKVVSINCGINHFAAVNNHGSLFTWGKNPGGCLGLGHIKDHYFPLRVSIGGEVVKVRCGVDHTVALVKELI